jgi:Na+/H+-dicarboxylate symporter
MMSQLETRAAILKRWNTMSTRILAGLIVGLAAGAMFASQPNAILDRVLTVTTPIGQLWLDALTMTVVPLVFSLLVTGVGSATSSAAAGGVATRAMVWFVILLVGACLISAALTTLLLAWAPIPVGGAGLRGPSTGAPVIAESGTWLAGLIPANPIKAAAEMSMAPLVVFALFFGFAASRIDAKLRDLLISFLEAVVATMLVIVQWVLLVGPLGVMALGFGVGAKLGLGAAGTLLQYVLVVVAACLAIVVAAYGLVAVIGRISPLAFGKAALPVQVVALGTQSSLACLPAMIRAARALRTTPGTSDVVLPLAVSIFRASSAAANVAVAVYLAHLHGVSVSPSTLGVGALVAAAVSLAAVGLPAQVSFFATIGPVCLAMGVPLHVLPILLAVEAIPDRFRALGGVTVDLAVTRIVGRSGRAGTDSRRQGRHARQPGSRRVTLAEFLRRRPTADVRRLYNLPDQTQSLCFLGLEIPVVGRPAQHLVHGHGRSAHQVFKTFVLNGDRVLDLVEERLDRGNAGGQRPVDLKGLVELALMDHQPRAAREIAVGNGEEAHEGRAGRIDRRLAEESQPALRRDLALEADILAHHPRDFRVTAQGR